MKYIEYLTKDLNEECFRWAKSISEEYQPDLVVYIARAGYIFAQPMNKVFNADLVGIGAVRKGNSIKEIIGPIMSYFPSFFRKILATFEIKSGIHKKNTEREVYFHPFIKDLECDKYKKILIVDDAVDTGYSMQKVVDVTRQRFKNAEIKTACFNMSCNFDECIIKVDYVFIQGYSVKTPFSKDSKEYRITKARYYEETKDEYI